jgi:hypothetical protein
MIIAQLHFTLDTADIQSLNHVGVPVGSAWQAPS